MSSFRAAASLLLLALALVAGCGDGEDEPASLDGTSWVLTDGVNVPQDVAVTMPTMAFAADEVSGTTGCNRYGGTYALDGDSIELGPLSMTQIGCPAPADRIEAEFTAALQDVRSFSMDGEDLVLADADGGELLRFETAPAS